MTHPIIQKVVAIVLSAITSMSGGNIHPPKLHTPTAHANGKIVYDCGVQEPAPFFVVNQMVPGDSVSKDCVIKNEDKVPRNIAVKGIKTGSSGDAPNLASIIDFKVAGPAAIFSDKLEQFFLDSSASDGVTLFMLGAGASRSITLTSTLPFAAGNEYQHKSLEFNLVFGTTSNTKIVINEVYFQVDKNHGGDDNKKNKESGQNSQWIEIYNAGSATMDLKNWTVTDNKDAVKIHPSKNIRAGEFILLTKDSSVWRHYPVVKNRKNDLELGQFPRLDKSDHLILKDPFGVIVDQIGWGSDNYVWNPSIVVGPIGSSIVRKLKGFDNDLLSDWKIQFIPTPGY